jgi:hypothetical protein
LRRTYADAVVEGKHRPEDPMDAAPRSGCPINAAVEVLGDPWAMLVLRDIMFGARRHVRELSPAPRRASPPTSSPVAHLVPSPIIELDAA